MNAQFSISDKIVLVDDSPKDKPGRSRDPTIPSGHLFCKRGGVYVVRDAWLSPVDGEALIQLVDVPECHTTRGNLRVGFGAWRFRRLSEVQAENAVEVEGRA